MPDERRAPVRDWVPVTTPAAGADWSFTNDKGEQLLVRYVTARLVTSVAAANRGVALSVASDSRVWGRFPAGTTQVASLTRFYTAMPGSVAGPDNASGVTLAWPTEGLLMDQGDVLSSVTALIDAADQWDRIFLRVYRITPSYPKRIEPFPSFYVHDELSGTVAQ